MKSIGIAALSGGLALLAADSAPAAPAGDGQDIFGSSFHVSQVVGRPDAAPVTGNSATEWLRRWNAIAIDASGVDHTPPAPGEDRIYAENYGPGRSSRAMAIVHIAMYDAVVAVEGGYESYSGLPPARPGTAVKVALAQAAHDALVALYPEQTAAFGALLAEDLDRAPRGRPLMLGIELGQRAATAILAQRIDDGSQHDEPLVGIDHVTSDLPGHWRQDPVSLFPMALGAYWGAVQPFVIESGAAFRVPPPPAMESDEYAAAFDAVKRIGGDGIVTPTERTPEQTFIGTFWAYDGTPSLCAPPRMYNQVAMAVADTQDLQLVELARLLALVNVAMADTGIAVWDSKWHYDFWRPITGIREADPGTGPTGLGDGNPLTVGDPDFMPLGAPASNTGIPNFTPPFPAYPSGHAGFGGALFQTLRRFFGTDEMPFTFVSDEWNGQTVDNEGNVRPLVPRSFETLSEAEDENGQSRIYLGIHWQFDKDAGIAQGNTVADYVFDHAFRAVPED